MIRVLNNGANGRMGRAMASGILKQDDIEIVAAVDVKGIGTDMGILAGNTSIGVPVENNLQEAIERTKPDVMLDFTNPQAIMKNIRIALTNSIACVVGTTGLTEANLSEIETLSKEKMG